MDLTKSFILLLFVGVVAFVLLFTPYEAYLEGILALGIVAVAAVGSLLHPRREIFYIRTAVRLIDPDRNHSVERDFLAVKVELVRLWLWFVPTCLAVAFLVFFAVGGPARFSFLNWVFSSQYSYLAFGLWRYPTLLILVLLSTWIEERRVMRDAEACSATTYSFSRVRVAGFRRVSYAFRGEHGEYYGGDCAYFGIAPPSELSSIVFYNPRKWELNKIAMAFVFHRFIVVGRGLTDLNKQTAAAQAILAETASTL